MRLEFIPFQKIVTPQGTFSMIHSMVNEDEEDNVLLSWKMNKIMVPTFIKGKKKETSEILLKKSPYLIWATTKKLMSDATKEWKICTFVGRRLRKAKFVEDLVLETNVVDLSQDASENKRKVRVSYDRDVKRIRKGIVEEPILLNLIRNLVQN